MRNIARGHRSLQAVRCEFARFSHIVSSDLEPTLLVLISSYLRFAFTSATYHSRQSLRSRPWPISGGVIRRDLMGQRSCRGPGNERADTLAGKAAEKASWSPPTYVAHLKLRVSRSAKEKTPPIMVRRRSPRHLRRSRAGQREKCTCSDCSADSHWSLAVCGLPEEDPQTTGR
jgi:hypothetical protein